MNKTNRKLNSTRLKQIQRADLQDKYRVRVENGRRASGCASVDVGIIGKVDGVIGTVEYLKGQREPSKIGNLERTKKRMRTAEINERITERFFHIAFEARREEKQNARREERLAKREARRKRLRS
jgi:hypothetical protein